METELKPSRHAYRSRISATIMTIDGNRRSCLAFGAIEAVEATTPPHQHDPADHDKMNRHIQTAMDALRAEGIEKVLTDSIWTRDNRHVIQVGTCCLSALDLERLMLLVIDGFNGDDDLGIRLLPCSCEENCTCVPATCDS